jgi:Phage integrase family
MLSAATGIRLTNSWIGSAPNLDCHSAKPWSHGIGCIWNPAASLPEPSTFVSERFAVLPMKLRIAQRRLGRRNTASVKKLGVRLGNWLTADQGQALWQAPDRDRIKGKRDRALLAVLLACGLRRHELAGLTVGHLQQREGHWAIVDLVVASEENLPSGRKSPD